MSDIAEKVTAKLNGSNTSGSDVLYRVQVGAFTKKENADAMLAKVKTAGFDSFITTEKGKAVSSSPAK